MIPSCGHLYCQMTNHHSMSWRMKFWADTVGHPVHVAHVLTPSQSYRQVEVPFVMTLGLTIFMVTQVWIM